MVVFSISPVFPILKTRELFGISFYRSFFSPIFDVLRKTGKSLNGRKANLDEEMPK